MVSSYNPRKKEKKIAKFTDEEKRKGLNVQYYPLEPT